MGDKDMNDCTCRLLPGGGSGWNSECPQHGGSQAGWRCFHCDEVFTDWGAARNHFGYTPEDGAPVCRVAGGTAAEIYHLRRQLALYQNEDTALHREIASLRADHATALRREEEKGYERGLRDGRAMIKTGPDCRCYECDHCADQRIAATIKGGE